MYDVYKVKCELDYLRSTQETRQLPNSTRSINVWFKNLSSLIQALFWRCTGSYLFGCVSNRECPPSPHQSLPFPPVSSPELRCYIEITVSDCIRTVSISLYQHCISTVSQGSCGTMCGHRKHCISTVSALYHTVSYCITVSKCISVEGRWRCGPSATPSSLWVLHTRSL